MRHLSSRTREQATRFFVNGLVHSPVVRPDVKDSSVGFWVGWAGSSARVTQLADLLATRVEQFSQLADPRNDPFGIRLVAVIVAALDQIEIEALPKEWSDFDRRLIQVFAVMPRMPMNSDYSAIREYVRSIPGIDGSDVPHVEAVGLDVFPLAIGSIH